MVTFRQSALSGLQEGDAWLVWLSVRIPASLIILVRHNPALHPIRFVSHPPPRTTSKPSSFRHHLPPSASHSSTTVVHAKMAPTLEPRYYEYVCHPVSALNPSGFSLACLLACLHQHNHPPHLEQPDHISQSLHLHLYIPSPYCCPFLASHSNQPWQPGVGMRTAIDTVVETRGTIGSDGLC